MSRHRARHGQQRSGAPAFRCGPCDRAAFTSRSAARSYAKRHHPDDVLTAYRCPANDAYWHNGHRRAAEEER